MDQMPLEWSLQRGGSDVLAYDIAAANRLLA